MFDYASNLRDYFVAALKGEFSSYPDCPDLCRFLENRLLAAQASGALVLPDAVRSHGMPLYHAFHQLGQANGPRYYLDHLLTWMARTHLEQIASKGRLIHRDHPEGNPQDHLEQLAAFATSLVDAGTFKAIVFQDSHLVRSQWNERTHNLSIENWHVVVKDSRVERLRLGAVLRPLTIAPVPETIEVELRFPTGRLLIGSNIPLPKINDKCIALRQAAQGLQGELAVTSQILDDHHVLALPVHLRSLQVLSDGDRTAIVHHRDVNAEPECQIADFLLDYRYLTIADEGVLRENEREVFDEPDEIVTGRLKDILSTTARQGDATRITISPGTYRVTLPANYLNQIPAGDGLLGEPDALIVHLERIVDR